MQIRRRDYSDVEVVEAIGQRNRAMEEWFYHKTKRYFDDHFNAVFFDKDRRQEVFQSAFLKLWMEMDNGRIKVLDGMVNRQQASGEYQVMTCSLTTFMMAFARTEFREIVRSTKKQTYDDLQFDYLQFNDWRSGQTDVMVTTLDEDPDEQRNRIVDECIQSMSPTCVEILTLFYYQGKSLDEIMELRKDKTSSKNGLKTSKNKCMNTLRERITKEFKRYNLLF